MRIVGGSAKGRSLLGPKSDRVTRPTADRVRQTVFDVLGQRCDGLVVLDLFAGTGALGLEALSRGAARATLVDRSREAVGLCGRNAEGLGFAGQVEILGVEVRQALVLLQGRGGAFDLVFVDPPYAQSLGGPTLRALAGAGLVASGGRVVVEHGREEALPDLEGPLSLMDRRRFGDTMVSIFELTGR